MIRSRSNQLQRLGALALVIASVLMLCGTVKTAHAQESAEAIRYGQQVLGQITPDNRVAFYYLRAERGDVISITMRRTSGDLDPHLDLATADGKILASNDDDPLSEGRLNAGIRNQTILKSGAYLIQATGFGSTAGSFVLSVMRTPPEEIGQTFEQAQLIDYGMALEVTLTDDFSERFFSFSADTGDILTVTARSQDVSPTVAILDSRAIELVRAADNERSGQARIAVFSVPAPGVYTLAAGATDRADLRDTAHLALELSGRAAPHAGQALEIAYGAVMSGLISAESPAEEFVFAGSAGDIVRISLERASGDLDPLVTLYAQDRKQIAFDDDGAENNDALIDGFTLPYDGLYIISASRYQRAQGQTAGAYVLRLEQIAAGE